MGKVSYEELKKAYEIYSREGLVDKQFECIRFMYEYNRWRTYPKLVDFRQTLTEKYNKGENRAKNMSIIKQLYFLTARDYFDDYCILLEWNRPVKKRFYLPRRKQLLPVVKGLQELANGELDLLAISLPPGTGKTALAIFYLTWLAGRNPNEPILGGSHNMSLLSGIYEECLRIITSTDDYLWKEIYPTVKLVSTNAKDLRIDLDKGKRFETIEFSSIGSGNAGKVRAVQLLYCDDLIDGIETALSKERLAKLWTQYTTDLRQRKQGNHCKELHIATRWSMYDPIGRLQELYGESNRAKFISIPALNDKDESNFDFPYGLGFSTKMYKEQRAIMDDASWRALYLNQPIEREGRLYDPEELRRYFILPEREPDAIVAVCDTKEQGMDYCVMPIGYKYGDDYYIDKFICDNGKPDIIMSRIIELLVSRNVDTARFESNRGGTLFAENVQKGIRERNGKTRITTKWNQTNKETRILINAGWVKEHCLFKDKSLYPTDKEYQTAMNFLCGYTMAGKNRFDDVPDAMSDFSDLVQSSLPNKIEIMKRYF